MASTSQKIIEAASILGKERGLSLDVIHDALVDAFKLAVGKKIEEEYKVELRGIRPQIKKPVEKTDKVVEKLESALVRVDCNLETGKISVYHQWLVLNEEDITDDFLQISLEEAKEHNKRIKVGDYYEEKFDLSTLNKKDVDRFVSTFKQKISKAEKEVLFNAFSDKIGNIMTGIVEKADSNSVLVNLGTTSTILYRNDLIGDERFQNGDPIKVYISDIARNDKKALYIKASRTCKEFLQKLFENEVNEINDGVVIIKDIARIPGKRSKVVVYSIDPNVDPSGACIGKNGERIQRIVQNLGNGRDYKEKIDVILYHTNLGVYLSEILKPGYVIGINFENEGKEAVVICGHDTMKLAVGLQGQNIKLAKMLTGLEKITVYNEEELEENGITSFTPIEKYIEEDEEDIKEEAKRRFREDNLKMMKAKGTILDDETLDEVVEEIPVTTEEVTEELVVTETKPEEKVEKIEEPTVETSEVKEVKEEVKKEPEVVEIKEVKTTTTLESLERSLEEEKKQKEEEKIKKAKRKQEKEAKKEEKKEDSPKKTVQKIDIYTKEELEKMEEEEFDDEYPEFDDEEWADYDSDDYYED